jgi:hypothetical protein
MRRSKASLPLGDGPIGGVEPRSFFANASEVDGRDAAPICITQQNRGCEGDVARPRRASWVSQWPAASKPSNILREYSVMCAGSTLRSIARNGGPVIPLKGPHSAYSNWCGKVIEDTNNLYSPSSERVAKITEASRTCRRRRIVAQQDTSVVKSLVRG